MEKDGFNLTIALYIFLRFVIIFNKNCIFSFQTIYKTSYVHQNETVYEAPDGFKISMTKVFGQIVTELSINDALIASSLMQTGRWNLSGNKISTTISNVYQKNKIEQNIHKINSLLETICHSKMIFEIQLLEKKNEPVVKPEFPKQVQVLCSAFKGSVKGSE